MKVVKTKFDPKEINDQQHPAIRIGVVGDIYCYNKLVNTLECKVVDGEEEHFKNNGDTLVIALPEYGNSSNKDNQNIWDWVDACVDGFMEAVGGLKPDEFEIEPLEGMEGYSRIARFWWD